MAAAFGEKSKVLKMLRVIVASGYISQWFERLTADQQVPGSNWGVPFFTYKKMCSKLGVSQFS